MTRVPPISVDCGLFQIPDDFARPNRAGCHHDDTAADFACGELDADDALSLANQTSRRSAELSCSAALPEQHLVETVAFDLQSVCIFKNGAMRLGASPDRRVSFHHGET